MESKKEKKTSQTKTSDLWLLEVGAGMEGGMGNKLINGHNISVKQDE